LACWYVEFFCVEVKYWLEFGCIFSVFEFIGDWDFVCDSWEDFWDGWFCWEDGWFCWEDGWFCWEDGWFCWDVIWDGRDVGGCPWTHWPFWHVPQLWLWHILPSGLWIGGGQIPFTQAAAS